MALLYILVMTLIVLPLSGLHGAGPYQLRGLIQGILVHMFLIGVPIAFCLYKFSMPHQVRHVETKGRLLP